MKDNMKTLLEAMSLTEEFESTGGQDHLNHILNRFKHEVKQFKAGVELDDLSDLYHALYDFYLDSGEMPYGVAKARDGDPTNWVTDRLSQELGSDSGYSSVGHPTDAADFARSDYEGDAEMPVFDESEALSPELDGKEMLDEGLEGTVSEILTRHGLDDGYDFFFENGLVAIGRDTAKVIIAALKNDPAMTSNPYISGVDGEEVRISFGKREARPEISGAEVRGLAYEPDHELDENRFAMDNPEMSDSEMSDHWIDRADQSHERMKDERRFGTPGSFNGDGSYNTSDDEANEFDELDEGAAEYECPYCGKECPSGVEPSMFNCCGEVGHAQPREDEEDDYTDYTMRQGEMGSPDRFRESKEVFEGKVKELSMDLKAEKSGGMSDAEFKKHYKKTKSEVKAEMNKSKKKVDESINLTISSEDADSFLADIKKLSGLAGNSEEHAEVNVQGRASPMSAVQELIAMEAKLANIPEVDEPEDGEYANEPDEQYFALDQLLKGGEDLNRPKIQSPGAAAKGDNPLTKRFKESEDRMWNAYQRFLDEARKDKKDAPPVDPKDLSAPLDSTKGKKPRGHKQVNKMLAKDFPHQFKEDNIGCDTVLGEKSKDPFAGTPFNAKDMKKKQLGDYKKRTGLDKPETKDPRTVVKNGKRIYEGPNSGKK